MTIDDMDEKHYNYDYSCIIKSEYYEAYENNN